MDGGGDLELEVGAQGGSLASHQVNSSSHPFFGIVPETRSKQSTSEDVQCVTAESFLQRH